MNELSIYLIPALLVLVAFLYASVGHGGASGYIAVLSLFSISTYLIKPSALILNIAVSGVAFVQFYRNGHFKWNLFWPFAVTSIPAAYLGGIIHIEPHVYQKILGICLIFPVLRLLGVFGENPDQIKTLTIYLALVIGAVIGFLSGMLGIGGGILLTPLLILLAWANMKEAAAVSALFIFVNSIAGLLALVQKKIEIDVHVWIWLVAALTGGWIGAYWGSKKYNFKTLRIILAAVLIIASGKLLLT